MGLVEIEVLGKATLCFFKIGSCLINGKRKMIEGDDDISCLIDIFIGRLLEALCSTKQQLCAFDEPHRFDFDRDCQRTNSIGTRRNQNASVAPLGKIVLDNENIIGIIKYQ